MTRLAQVAGSICPRSLAEMEHAALVLIREHEPHDQDTILIAYLADVVRLIREVGQPRDYRDQGLQLFQSRPGSQVGP